MPNNGKIAFDLGIEDGTIATRMLIWLIREVEVRTTYQDAHQNNIMKIQIEVASTRGSPTL